MVPVGYTERNPVVEFIFCKPGGSGKHPPDEFVGLILVVEQRGRVLRIRPECSFDGVLVIG